MRRIIALIALASLAVGACANDADSDARDEVLDSLVDAFVATGKATEQTVTMRLVGTPASLAAFGEGALTQAQAGRLIGASITASGIRADDPEDALSRMTVEVPGTGGAEITGIGWDGYVRADVEGLMELLGSAPSGLRELEKQASTVGAGFVRPLLDNKVVKIEGLEQLAGQAGMDPNQLTTARQEQLVEELGKALRDLGRVTSEGEEETGEHLVATVPLRGLFERFIAAAEIPLPGGRFPDAADVPNRDLALDVWVDDEGRISQIEFDLAQIAEIDGDAAGVEELVFRMTFSYSVDDAITAPDHAATMDATDVLGLVMGFGGFAGLPGATPRVTVTPPSAPAVRCSIYKDLPPETFEGLPPEVLQELEKMCPGLVPAQ